MTKRSLTRDILNRRFCLFSINNVRTNTAPPVIKRVNFPSCMAEGRTPLCSSPTMVCLPALLGCKEQICVQSLPGRAYFIGLLPLLIKTSASHPKDLVLFFTVLPQASLVSSVSPLPQLSRPTSTWCRIFLAALGTLKQQ